MDVNVDRIPLGLKEYVSAARRDPDGTAVRLALTRKVTINSMAAGEKLFVDLLPENWAGLPPGLAGLFAKLSVVDALVDADWTWLAGVVVLNAVIALAYYVRVAAVLYTGRAPAGRPVARPVAAALVAAVAVAVVLGFAPQVLFDALS